MERISLFLFNVRAFFQSLWYVLLRLCSKKVSERYLKHIDKTEAKFGIRAIRKEWHLVLCVRMRYFALLPEFRRELILSKLNDVLILDMLRFIDRDDLSLEEVKMIALNRRFNKSGTDRLSWFKSKLFCSELENKLEIIKIFYKSSEASESSAVLSDNLLKLIGNDLEFLYWLAISKDASATIKRAFIRKITAGDVSNDSKSKLRSFVEKVGLKDCDIENLNGYSELLLDIRQYLTRPEDVEIWEYYLLKGKNPEIIKLNVRRYGIESKNGLKMLLELNNTKIIDAYNFHYSVANNARLTQ